jgi:hypothetical protein
MNDHAELAGINFRSHHYCIARTAGMCRQCHGETVLVALMLPPKHEVLSIDEEEAPTGDDASIGDGVWESVPRHAFLFYIEFLPDEVRQHLQFLAPMYRFAASPATQGFQWANHCGHCGAFQEDHDLFCEPEGAFSPVSPAAAARIELLPVPEALAVSAAGYAIDPQYVAFRPVS